MSNVTNRTEFNVTVTNQTVTMMTSSNSIHQFLTTLRFEVTSDVPVSVRTDNDTLSYDIVTDSPDINRSTTDTFYKVIPADYIRGLFVTILSLLTISVNILNLVTLCRARNFRRATRYFLLSLTVADLAVGFIMPWHVYPNITLIWPFGYHFCLILAQICCVSFAVSIWMLMFLSFDRFLAIWRPLRYSSILNPRTAKVIISLTWIGSLTVMSLPLFGVGKFYFSPTERLCSASAVDSAPYMKAIAIFLAPPFTFIYIWNALLWQKACLEIRRLSNMNEMSSTQYSTDRKRRRQLMAAVTIGVVVLVFSVTWLPCFLWNLHAALTGIPLPPEAEYIIMWLGLSNSCLNFFIFVSTNRHFRQHVLAMLKCMSAEKYASNKSMRRRVPSSFMSGKKLKMENSDSGFNSTSNSSKHC